MEVKVSYDRRSDTIMAMTKSVKRLAILLGLSAIWLYLSCTPAVAHARLLETYPADGSDVPVSPRQVQLLFNEPVQAEFDPLKVYEQGGDRVDEANARVSPNNRKLLVVDLEELPEGSYTVDWRVVSTDGHPISGAGRFAVNASATGGLEEPIEPIEQSVEQEASGGAFTHYIHIVGLGLAALIVLVVALLRKKN